MPRISSRGAGGVTVQMPDSACYPTGWRANHPHGRGVEHLKSARCAVEEPVRRHPVFSASHVTDQSANTAMSFVVTLWALACSYSGRGRMLRNS
jgi:hypothetical protein